MKKKLLSFLSTAGASLILSVTAGAAVGDTFVIDDNTYKVLTETETTGTVALTAPKYTEGQYVVASEVENNGVKYTVTTIGLLSFKNQPISDVVLPNTITTIEMLAFYHCPNLTHINLPPSIIKTGVSAFPSGIEELTIPASLETISAVGEYENLEKVTVEEGNPVFSMFEGVLINKSTDNILWIPKSTEEFTIPYHGKTKLASWTANNSNLRKVTFLDSDQTIVLGHDSFSSCKNLEEVVFGKVTIEEGASAFSECTAIKEIDLSNVTFVKNDTYSFYGCTGLERFIFNPDMTTIPGGYLQRCTNLTFENIVWPEKLNKISASAFENCSGCDIFIVPPTVTDTEYHSFQNMTGLIAFSIPVSDEEVVVIPDEGSYLKTLKSIKNSGLRGNYNMVSAFFSKNITKYDNLAFADCTSLKYLFLTNPTPAKIYSDTFTGIPEDATLYVPSESKETYLASDWAKYFKNIEGINYNDYKMIEAIEPAEEVLLVTTDEPVTAHAIITPEDASHRILKWISDDESVAKVDDNGTVTGIASGKTTIRAYATDGSCKKMTMTVDVSTTTAADHPVCDIADNTIEVYTLDGIRIYSGLLSDWHPVRKGIYIIKSSEGVSRQIVR